MWSMILRWHYMYIAANAVKQASVLDHSLEEMYLLLYKKTKEAEKEVNEAARKGLFD